ncbi:MAG: chemotaxis protein methyltransferase CheR [Methanolobus sp.]|jgi:chemotaxis protein methyltransferase CheR|uniref:CheR family methyltransferase n=1 Tax=Methanolobus sp. TaxID=1874737 RepID=UPI0024AB6F7F|nr:CheR family methyltransferase [Methanolobus sp.]MDI3486221.1 chemotaxis protein methyltransferase CheR [Methanolobus sp.]MDK2830278.1 chemotaxis protein methyltransferase CheR [Methanolobus sp.]
MAFTYFFRDMQTLEMIRDYVIPELRSRRYIHIWDAGCAMGPEPYSLAIVLRENMGMIFRNVKIHATDIDNSNLFGDIIKDGIYPREMVQRIPQPIFEKYFSPADEPDHFQISDEIRKSVDFTRQNLLDMKPIRSGLNLILCKNVLLHFTEAERVEVMQMFHDSLDGGYFATEQTQKLPAELQDHFEPVVANAQLYRKINN